MHFRLYLATLLEKSGIVCPGFWRRTLTSALRTSWLGAYWAYWSKSLKEAMHGSLLGSSQRAKGTQSVTTEAGRKELRTQVTWGVLFPIRNRGNGIELKDNVFKISGAIKGGKQKTRVVRHDCDTRGHTWRLLRFHVWGLIIGIHWKQIQEEKSNKPATHGRKIEKFVQFMSQRKTNERSDKLIFSQTRIKVVPSWGIWRHRNQINVKMALRGKRGLNIGTIGTTAEISNKYRTCKSRRNPRETKWNNSSSNHETNRLRVNRQKKVENEIAV